MIDEDRTMQLYGYYSSDLSPKSNKPIVKVCDKCGEYKVIKKNNYHNLCRSCSHKHPCKLPKPKFVEDQDRFIINTQIDRILTIEKFGYDPVDLTKGSGRKVIAICQDCGKNEILVLNHYHDLCASCARKKYLKPPIPRYVTKEDRFIPETGIDRIQTIKKFGYDPVDLSEKSGRKVIVICQECGKSRITTKHDYRDICRLCTYKNEEIQIIKSCIKQGISREDFSGFIGRHPERDYVLSSELCIQLNTKFKGSEFHHIMSGVGVYIPKYMNHDIPHNMKTGKNMMEINKLTIDYLRGEF